MRVNIPHSCCARVRPLLHSEPLLCPFAQVKDGIRAISIGVNDGSPAPAMPNPGVWLDPLSNTSVMYMQVNGEGAAGTRRQSGHGAPHAPMSARLFAFIWSVCDVESKRAEN